jgi:GTPase involved in cell partitioning and DNA repair
LILNIGTPNTENSGKTSFISKLLSIKEELIGGAHFSNILNLYTKIKLDKTGNFILADFNGVVSDKM